VCGQDCPVKKATKHCRKSPTNTGERLVKYTFAASNIIRTAPRRILLLRMQIRGWICYLATP